MDDAWKSLKNGWKTNNLTLGKTKLGRIPWETVLEIRGVQEFPQMTFKKNRDTVQVCRDGDIKAKVHLELYLARDMKSTKWAFTGLWLANWSPWKTWAHYWMGQGTWCWRIWKSLRYLVTSSSQSLLRKFTYRNQTVWHQRSMNEERPTLGGGGSGNGTFKQIGHTQVHGAWWDTPTNVTGDDHCHWEAILDHLRKTEVVRRAPEDWKKANVTFSLQEGSEGGSGKVQVSQTLLGPTKMMGQISLEFISKLWL